MRGGARTRTSEDILNRIKRMVDDGERSPYKIFNLLHADKIFISRSMVKNCVEKLLGRHVVGTTTYEKARALLLAGQTHSDVALTLGIKRGTVSNISSEMNSNGERALQPVQDKIKALIEERLSIGRVWRPGRYMIAGDFHVKFHSMEAFNQMMAHKGDFDGAIVPGDFFDEFWISSFRKEQRQTYTQELNTVDAMLMHMTSRFGRVLMINGNHEERRWKQLLTLIGPAVERVDEDEAVNDLYAVIDKIRARYYHKVPGVTVHPGWFVDICNGKIIISHPDRFMSVPGNTSKAVVEHMYNNRKDYKLQNFDAFLMGHTHRLDGPKSRIGVTTWELPAMCPLLSYQVSPRASSLGKIDTGYSILETRADGSFRFNGSRSYLVDGW